MFKGKKIYSVPIFGFMIMIIITTFLLKLPICNNQSITFVDAIFQAASMITATGSSVVNNAEQFTFLGQFVMLIAMQVGAIGFMLFFSLLFIVSKKKLSLSDCIFLSNEISTSNFTSIRIKAKKITRYTLTIEFMGAWLLALKFIPVFGTVKGIWYSIFHSVSAFCNVGADVIGANSMVMFVNDKYINIIFIILMFFGSLGFFVLEDLVDWFLNAKKHNNHIQSRLILDMSLSILLIGTLLVKIYDPSLTLMQSIFEVVTARNTGFFTIDPNTLSEMNRVLISILMFIGGGPGSNAGGIRVVVFAIMFLTMFANITGEEQIVVFYRGINDKLIKKAMAIFMMDLSIVFVGMLMISLTDGYGVLDIVFYVVSTFSNTGLVTIDMETMSSAGKIISIIIMYIGRIAPITFVSLFTPVNNKKSGIKYPDMDLML